MGSDWSEAGVGKSGAYHIEIDFHMIRIVIFGVLHFAVGSSRTVSVLQADPGVPIGVRSW